MTDLADWVDMATNEFGFYVMLRPGPYICAEWDGGGYPQWLALKKPAGFKGMWYRGDDATYLAWCKHWYTAVARVAVDRQITHKPAGKPGVILWQIENEYDYDGAAHSAEVKLHQLQSLAHNSRDLGIDVPLFTCVTSNALFRKDPFLLANVIDTRNTYPKFDMTGMLRGINSLDQYQPEKPKMVTELQGGWFSNVGGSLSEALGLNAAQINHITMLAWANGFTSTNYYMAFGGTNLGDWAARNITTTYDYDAPLKECGGIGPRYLAVAAMGAFVRDYGTNLTRSSVDEAAQVQITSNPKLDISYVVRRAPDRTRYVFVFNNDRDHAAKVDLTFTFPDLEADHQGIGTDLSPFDAKVFVFGGGARGNGQWFPEAVAAPSRPTTFPAAIALTKAERKIDSGPADWKPTHLATGAEGAGVYDRRFIYYRANLPAGIDAKQTVLLAQHAGRDAAMALVNGNRLTSFSAGAGAVAFDLSSVDKQGGPITLIYQNDGRSNGGPDMEALNGFHGLSIVDRALLPRSLSDWKMNRLTDRKAYVDFVATNTDDHAWAAARVEGRAQELKEGESAVYRTHIQLTDAEVAAGGRALVIGRIDDSGEVYVNGELAGKTDASNAGARVDLSKLLKSGDNVLAVLVDNKVGQGGMGRGASLEPVNKAGVDSNATILNWSAGIESEGLVGKWWDPAMDVSGWDQVDLAGKVPAKAETNSLTWYRTNFDLPAIDPHTWIPWKAKIDAEGNGFIYLNGHPLGRWWQVGPQREFYLPECWMHFGPGETNTLAFCLRPTDVAALKGVTVLPYTEFAELR
jgi:hypothetical protein